MQDESGVQAVLSLLHTTYCTAGQAALYTIALALPDIKYLNPHYIHEQYHRNPDFSPHRSLLLCRWATVHPISLTGRTKSPLMLAWKAASSCLQRRIQTRRPGGQSTFLEAETRNYLSFCQQFPTQGQVPKYLVSHVYAGDDHARMRPSLSLSAIETLSLADHPCVCMEIDE